MSDPLVVTSVRSVPPEVGPLKRPRETVNAAAVRNRAAATAIAALFAATPLAFGTAAYADGPVQDSGKEVVVQRRRAARGGLRREARAPTSVTVPAESSLRVVNNTGRRAKLRARRRDPGRDRRRIRRRRCCSTAARCRWPSSPTACWPTSPPYGRKSSPRRPRPHPRRPGSAPAPRAARPAPPRATDTAAVRRPARTAGRTTRAEDPRERPDSAATASAEPTTPAAEPTPADGTETATATVDGNLPALTEPTDSVTVAGANAEPLASVEPVRTGGSTGLLALIAAVCAVGVIRRGNSGYYRSTCNSDSHSVRSTSLRLRGAPLIQPRRCGRSSPGPTQRMRIGRPAASSLRCPARSTPGTVGPGRSRSARLPGNRAEAGAFSGATSATLVRLSGPTWVHGNDARPPATERPWPPSP